MCRFRERKRWRTVTFDNYMGMPMFLIYDHMMNRGIIQILQTFGSTSYQCLHGSKKVRVLTLKKCPKSSEKKLKLYVYSNALQSLHKERTSVTFFSNWVNTEFPIMSVRMCPNANPLHYYALRVPCKVNRWR